MFDEERNLEGRKKCGPINLIISFDIINTSSQLPKHNENKSSNLHAPSENKMLKLT